MMAILDNNVNRLGPVLVSDRYNFTSVGLVNSQNYRYGFRKNPHFIKEHTPHPENVYIWATIVISFSKMKHLHLTLKNRLK